MDFVCPKCKGPLSVTPSGTARCPLGHSFDRGRVGGGGYYNLLLQSGGGTHGDNREMVFARRGFLSRDYYRPLATAVGELCLANSGPNPRVLDAGCGEGYYTDTVERALASRDGVSRVMAFDISRDAVRSTARRNPRISLAVAGSYDMPVADGSVDLLINTFSPLALSEVVRVLAQDGVFIFVYPGEEHLFELKSVIYDTPYKNKPEDTALVGLRCLETRRLTYKMQLPDNGAVSDLFMMTPYAYRTSSIGRERVGALESLDCTADFYIGIYQKDN